MSSGLSADPGASGRPAPRAEALAALAVFAALAVAGLAYVKWLPYWDRAWTAAAHHSIGKSILTGGAAGAPAPSLQAAIAYGLAYGKAIWKALVLALLLGSATQALLPADLIARRLGSRGLAGAAAGGALALPGMMCACCAAPIVVGLRRGGAAVGAAVAFWLASPILNPATLVFIGFVLGWKWAALRLGLGLPMVLGLGWLANRMTGEGEARPGPIAAPPRGGPFLRWLRILARMSLQLVPEYLILVLLLGAARAWLFPAVGPAIGNQLGWIVLFALAGTLFVIPTAGEAPIIQTMLALGMGAGPAGALLLTLPAVSLPSLAMVGWTIPPRVLAVTAAGVALIGVAAGLIAAGARF